MQGQSRLQRVIVRMTDRHNRELQDVGSQQIYHHRTRRAFLDCSLRGVVRKNDTKQCKARVCVCPLHAAHITPLSHLLPLGRIHTRGSHDVIDVTPICNCCIWHVHVMMQSRGDMWREEKGIGRTGSDVEVPGAMRVRKRECVV